MLDAFPVRGTAAGEDMAPAPASPRTVPVPANKTPRSAFRLAANDNESKTVSTAGCCTYTATDPVFRPQTQFPGSYSPLCLLQLLVDLNEKIMADVYAAYVDDSEAPPGEPRVSPAELKPRKEGIMAICNKIGLPCIAPRRKINVMIVGNHSAGKSSSELTRTPRRLRWVRTGYAYQPPALCTYRTRRAACP